MAIVHARPQTPPPCEAELRSQWHYQVQLGNEREGAAVELWGAHSSRVLAKASSPSRTFLPLPVTGRTPTGSKDPKVRFGETPKPALETSALPRNPRPRLLGIYRHASELYSKATGIHSRFFSLRATHHSRKRREKTVLGSLGLPKPSRVRAVSNGPISRTSAARKRRTGGL